MTEEKRNVLDSAYGILYLRFGRGYPCHMSSVRLAYQCPIHQSADDAIHHPLFLLRDAKFQTVFILKFWFLLFFL